MAPHDCGPVTAELPVWTIIFLHNPTSVLDLSIWPVILTHTVSHSKPLFVNMCTLHKRAIGGSACRWNGRLTWNGAVREMSRGGGLSARCSPCADVPQKKKLCCSPPHLSPTDL